MVQTASSTETTAGALTPSTTMRPFQQWYMVGILTLVYTLSFIDRAALNIVVEPIRRDLHLTDVQMSVLIGFSFVSTYTVLILPAGYIADLVSRRRMIASAVAFWSFAAVFGGTASSYWQLFAGRAGLGAGEAALPPAAYSMIRDGVEEKARGRAFALYQTGVNLGYGLGAYIGGGIFALAVAGAFSAWPIVGALKPWQLVIVLPGLFGMIVTALLLTVREPRRRAAQSASEPVSFRELFVHVRRNARIYFVIFGAVIAISLCMAGWNAWVATSLIRTWGLTPAVVGQSIGLMALIVFPVATFAVGFVMDMIKKRNLPHAPFYVAIASCLLNVGPAMLVLHAPSLALVWAAYFISILFTTSGVQVACGMMLAEVTPGRVMGKMTSIYYMTSNLIGAGFGPTAVALVSKYGFAQGPRAISYAMTVCYLVLIATTIALLLLGAREIKRQYAARA